MWVYSCVVWVRFEWKVSALKVQFECTASCPQVGACALGLFCTLWVKHKCAFLVKSELHCMQFEFRACEVDPKLFAFWVKFMSAVCAFWLQLWLQQCLVQLAQGEASRGRPDTIRRPFPVISGASKCDGDCDDVRMRHPRRKTDTINRRPVAF